MGFLQDYLPPSRKTMIIAITSIMTALVCAVTFSFPILVNALTGGYFNIGEIVIYIAAILFGPFIGGFAGGVGAALADAIVAPQFIIGTLPIKFLEGFIVGYIVYTAKLKSWLKYWETWKERGILILAVLIGGIVMVIGYFFYELTFWAIGDAIGEIPINIAQVLVGLGVAVPASIRIHSSIFPEERLSEKIN
ncbi:MAG: ECF transporter S component [Candidatus Helarchaeota archaeon]|nr:ECF transporter S component [Candidatus Helarchaeota archaeon]